MSCCDTKKPRPPALTPTLPLVAACPACPDMEIEINETPAGNDDLVLLKCEHPAHRTKTKCRIRSKNCASGASATVVLVNPDGKLRFPEAADTTRTVFLPTNGSWVTFEISGETGSIAVGDAVIEAHCGTATGVVKATAKVTVVSFDPSKIDIATPGIYSLMGTTFTTTGGHAVDYSAEATIKPAGVDCTALQIKDLRIGIMQNVCSGMRRVDTWGNPTIAPRDWAPSVPSGTSITIPDTICSQVNRPVDANDTDAAADPLYDQPNVTTTVDANSLSVPKGCPGGATATSTDTPANSRVAATYFLPVTNTTTGALVAKATYTLIGTTIDNDFTTWAAVYNITTKEACAIRERTWSVHVDSAATGTLKASAGTDGAPTKDPIIGGPFSNNIVNNPKNQTTTQSGSKKFTKP